MRQSAEWSEARAPFPATPRRLYYNNSTRAQAIDEYNWFYAAAPAGSGTCGTTVPPCITPLTVDADFDNYIVPTDAAFDLGFILSNDPRPFYAHVTNLVGGANALAYPLLEKILGTYRAAFTTATPVVNLTLTQAADQLIQQQQWATDKNTVTGYVLNGAVTITNGTGHSVPFTAPVGSTIAGATLEPYGGEVSAWLTAGSKTGTVLDNALGRHRPGVPIRRGPHHDHRRFGHADGDRVVHRRTSRRARGHHQPGHSHDHDHRDRGGRQCG